MRSRSYPVGEPIGNGPPIATWTEITFTRAELLTAIGCRDGARLISIAVIGEEVVLTINSRPREALCPDSTAPSAGSSAGYITG